MCLSSTWLSAEGFTFRTCRHCDRGPCWCFPQYRGPFYFCLLVWGIQTFTPPVWATDGARTWTTCHAHCYALLLSFKQFPSLTSDDCCSTVWLFQSVLYGIAFDIPPQLTLHCPLAMFHVVPHPTTILSQTQKHLLFLEWLCIIVTQQWLTVLWFMLLY